MSRSYRKPYASVTTHSNSQDKVDAARSVRRRQEQAIKKFKSSQHDWDEFMIPIRRECPHNDVYDWSRDGRQRLQGWTPDYFNPYWLVCRYTHAYRGEEWIFQNWLDHIERHAKWLEKISRK